MVKSSVYLNRHVFVVAFFMTNSAEHEIFSPNKYENDNNSKHILLAEKFSCSAMFSKKEFSMVCDLLAGQISCSVALRKHAYSNILKISPPK